MGILDCEIRLTIDDKLKKEQITRYELAKRTGIKYQTIDAYYKNTVKRYDSEILLKICLALGCDIEDIMAIKNIR